MNKRHLHHIWTKFRIVKPWYFLVIFIISASVSIVALRANNEHMNKLRTALYTADKNDTNVQQALQNLQSYVTANMNTNLSSGPNAVYPPIQLKYTYNRLLQAQSQQASETNAQLYTDAQNYCQAQDPIDFSGHNRVPCIEEYVESHGAQAATIPAALYEFDFISPIWSPDLAGWSIIVTALSALLFLVSAVIRRWFKHTIA